MMSAVRFGFVDKISDNVRYRNRGKTDPLEAYERALMNQGVRFQLHCGNNDVFVVTPDDPASALGRNQAIRNAADEIRRRCGTPFSDQLHERLNAERDILLESAVPLDFWA
jgi:hypothetical protein